MKKIAFISLMFVLLGASLLAQSDFSRADIYFTYFENTVGPNIEINANSQLSSHFKLTYAGGYYQDFKNTAYQISAGFAYTPKDWLIIGLRGGIKKGPNYPFISG